MFFRGRLEKRYPLAITLYLLSLEGTRREEQASSENVSSLGARVLTKNRWEVGERLRMGFLTGEFLREGRVVYCERLEGGFRLGVELEDYSGKWWESSGARKAVSRLTA
jgi:hypothetical protein